VNVYNLCLTLIAKLLRSFDCGWKTPKGVKMISRRDVHQEKDLNLTKIWKTKQCLMKRFSYLCLSINLCSVNPRQVIVLAPSQAPITIAKRAGIGHSIQLPTSEFCCCAPPIPNRDAKAASFNSTSLNSPASFISSSAAASSFLSNL
jgi:hypothetical protein